MRRSNYVGDPKLRACPCCGGKADVFEFARAALSSQYEVRCLKCGVRTPRRTLVDSVVELWNRRPKRTR